MEPERCRSNAWFLLPILLSIIGGAIAYFVLREDDPAKARNCLYLGIALTAINLVVNAILPFTLLDIDPGFEVNL